MIMMTTALSTSLLLFIFIVSVTSIALDIRYPQFFHQSLNDSAVEITEGKSPGSFIAFVNLINSSQIIPNEWSLNLTETDFKIQSNALSYSLITTQTLDRERRDLYDFSIYARHLVPPYETISKPIRIRILDLNDCTPTFNQTIYHTTIIPNQSTFMITAHDDDEPQTENSRISYALSNYQDLFRINETTGVIECIKDPNTNERYELIVVARDHGKPSLTSSTLVQVQLVSPRAFLANSSAWLHSEQKLFIFAGILAAIFVCVSLSVCTLCWLKYRMRKRQEKKSLTTTTHHHPLNSILSQKKFSSSASSTSSTDLQQQTASGQFTRLTDDHQFERAAVSHLDLTDLCRRDRHLFCRCFSDSLRCNECVSKYLLFAT